MLDLDRGGLWLFDCGGIYSFSVLRVGFYSPECPVIQYIAINKHCVFHIDEHSSSLSVKFVNQCDLLSRDGRLVIRGSYKRHGMSKKGVT